MIKINWFDENTRNGYAECIEKVIKDNYQKHGANFPNKLKYIIFLDENKKYSSEKVKKFIMMSYDDVICNPILKEYIDQKSKNSIKNKKENETIKSVFKYENLNRIKDIRYSRDGLLISLNVAVCPYCNRQYITKFGTRSSADLDHYFPKDKYPLFALSLFNFVPSCQICNSRTKGSSFLGENGEMPLYPYKFNYGDNAVFKVSDELDAETLLNIWLGNNKMDLKVVLESNLEESDEIYKQIIRSKELYKIEEIYQAHKNYVSELLLKKRIYGNGEYIESLRNIFHDNQNDIDLDDAELQSFLYGYNWQNGEDVNRPLSKLTYDILMRD